MKAHKAKLKEAQALIYSAQTILEKIMEAIDEGTDEHEDLEGILADLDNASASITTVLP